MPVPELGCPDCKGEERVQCESCEGEGGEHYLDTVRDKDAWGPCLDCESKGKVLCKTCEDKE